MRVAAHGLAAELPRGWEATIATESQVPGDGQVAAFSTTGRTPQTMPVAQFATFALPPVRDDFGGAAVGRMGRGDVFISLLEYSAQEATSALFSDRGLPRRLDPRAFSPRMLQRRIPGHAGLQLFFNEHGRAFCLYIVLGDADDAHRLVRRAEQVLATIEIEE